MRDTFDIVTHQRTGEQFLRWQREDSTGTSWLFSRLSPRLRNRRRLLDATVNNPWRRVWFRTHDMAAYQMED
jgi:hypothetical protein